MHPDSDTAPEVDPEALDDVERTNVADAPEDDDPQTSAGGFAEDLNARHVAP